MNLEQLKEPFAVNEVSWRIGQAGKSGERVWAKVLAYIDNRCIQDRLDAVVGPANWKNEYTKGPEGGVLCGLSIKIDGEWVTKWDGAENSDIEAVKGGLSDAMKRAAVHWGIGRYLYELGESFAEIVDKGTASAHYANCKIKVSGKEEYVTFHWLPPKGVLPGSKPPPQRATPASVNQIEAQTKQASQALAEPLDPVRRAADDLVISTLLVKVKQHANYPEALNNLLTEAKAAYEAGNGHVRQRIREEVKPAIVAELKKLEPQTA